MDVERGEHLGRNILPNRSIKTETPAGGPRELASSCQGKVIFHDLNLAFRFNDFLDKDALDLDCKESPT